ncbi:hypothetical protein [Streptomyces sp. KHY 26]|uniref:hypothetical protein n=1 Tax=Streptomyces sp. KHY 26 TaxID=3097359 RepID=UPI00376F405D
MGGGGEHPCGLPVTAGVVVVGHDDGTRGGLPVSARRRGAGRRADGVAEVFRSAPAVHPERPGSAGEAVTLLADIEVATRSEGEAPPVATAGGPDAAAARGHAFVVVEPPRPGSGDAG